MREEQEHALERLKEILNEIGDLSAEAEGLLEEFPEHIAQAEAYGVFQWGWSSNPYDTTLSSIVDSIKDDAENEDDPVV